MTSTTHSDSNCCLTPAGWGNRLPEGISHPGSFPHAFSSPLALSSFFLLVLLFCHSSCFFCPLLLNHTFPPFTTSKRCIKKDVTEWTCIWFSMWTCKPTKAYDDNQWCVKQAKGKDIENGMAPPVSKEFQSLVNDIKECRQNVKQIVLDQLFVLSSEVVQNLTRSLFCFVIYLEAASSSQTIWFPHVLYWLKINTKFLSTVLPFVPVFPSK